MVTSSEGQVRQTWQVGPVNPIEGWTCPAPIPTEERDRLVRPLAARRHPLEGQKLPIEQAPQDHDPFPVEVSFRPHPHPHTGDTYVRPPEGKRAAGALVVASPRPCPPHDPHANKIGRQTLSSPRPLSSYSFTPIVPRTIHHQLRHATNGLTRAGRERLWITGSVSASLNAATGGGATREGSYPGTTNGEVARHGVERLSNSRRS